MARRKTPSPPPEKGRAELRALLSECRAHLDDDASRLVLADWLEEHGDEPDRARAELIRIQIAQPCFDSSRTYTGETERRRELISRHGKAWLGPLEFLCLPHRARHERGLVMLEVDPRQYLTRYAATLAGSENYAWVEGLLFRNLQNVDVADVLASPLFAPITRLRLDELGYSNCLSRLARAPQLRQLRGLELSPRWLRARELAESPYLDNLQWLRLQSRDTGMDDLLPLLVAPALAGLTRLDLSATPLGSAGLRELLAACPLSRLRSLDLDGCGLADDAELGELSRLGELAFLNLGRNRLGEQALAGLARADLPRLAELNLHDCAIPPAGLSALVPASFLSRLRVLVLRKNRVDVNGLRPLARGAGLGELRALQLDDNPLGPAGAAALSALDLPRLEQLSLSGCQLGPDGAAHLARWPGLARVGSLDLGGNALGGDGLRALLESPHLTSLVCLDIEHNAVGNAAIEALACSPLLARLETLRLADNALTSRALEALMRSPHLGNLQRLFIGTLRYQLGADVARKARRHFGERLR
jgi:uncharacterized protein (TIGR02996 family)